MLGSGIVAGAAAQVRASGDRGSPANASIARAVQAYGSEHRPTAVLVMRDDSVAARWGDPARPVDVRSVRKSLVGALYGIAIAEGRFARSDTLGELGIDDTPPSLTAAEKKATIEDLLTARSGVYHAAASEIADVQAKRPARGSHPPGTFWLYNNWDFNALGTIYRARTGTDIFAAFDRRIARPIGMEDWSARDGRTVRSALSRHPADHFVMSARDLARFGLLYLHGGMWEGRAVLPSRWVAESTRTIAATDHPDRGYGYLWWTLPSPTWGPGAFMAAGYGGQCLIVVPDEHLVLVETAAGPGATTRAFLALSQSIVSMSRTP